MVWSRGLLPAQLRGEPLGCFIDPQETHVL